MKTSLVNRRKSPPLRMDRVRRLVDWLAGKLEAAMPAEAWSEVCVVLAGDDGIAATHAEYFGEHRPTDVISFRYDPVPGEGPAWSGDLVVNVDRAIAEGAARDGADHELALYIAHGFDHLSGAEDGTPAQRRGMRATETAWLREAAAQGLLDGLFG